jgi:hypothetical protein
MNSMGLRRRYLRIAWGELRCWWHTLWSMWSSHCRFTVRDGHGKLIYLGCVIVGEPTAHRSFYWERSTTGKGSIDGIEPQAGG